MTNDDYVRECESYVERISDTRDTVLAREVVVCVHTEAYRAAYVMVWLSIAESLRRRFCDSASRDHVAQKISGEVERREADHKSVDAYLLEKAKEYGFVSNEEFAKLRHIYEMRCVYGHPYENAPAGVEVLAAFSIATDAVLAKPLRLREGYLSDQVQLLTGDRTFLDDTRQSVEPYADQVYLRSDTELHKWFMDKLWAVAEKAKYDPPLMVFVRRCSWFSARFLLNDNAKALAERNAVDDLVRFPYILTLVYSDPDVYGRLDQHARSIVIGKLVELIKQHVSAMIRIDKLDAAGHLIPRDLERIRNAVDAATLPDLVSNGIHPKHYAHRFIDAMKSYNWYTQNPAIDELMNVDMSKLASLSPDILKALGRNILQSAEGGSGSARAAMKRLAEFPWDVVLGAFEETIINEDGKVRVKGEQVREAGQALLTLDTAIRNAFIEELAARIRIGQWKTTFVEIGLPEYLEVLEELDNQVMNAQGALKPIAEAIRALQGHQNTQGITEK